MWPTSSKPLISSEETESHQMSWAAVTWHQQTAELWSETSFLPQTQPSHNNRLRPKWDPRDHLMQPFLSKQKQTNKKLMLTDIKEVTLVINNRTGTRTFVSWLPFQMCFPQPHTFKCFFESWINPVDLELTYIPQSRPQENIELSYWWIIGVASKAVWTEPLMHLAELRDEWLHTYVLTEVKLERGSGFFIGALPSPFLHFFPNSGC